MTTVDALYRYSVPPTEAAVLALNNLREVYGVRRLTIDEAAKTVRVEYDATRFGEPVVRQLLRRAGLQVAEAETLVLPAPPPAPPAQPAAAPAKA